MTTNSNTSQSEQQAKSKFAEFKDKAAEKFNNVKDAFSEKASKHNISMSTVKEKAKDWTAEGLEGASRLTEKLAGAAHNASQKIIEKKKEAQNANA